jgi:hypothetical protein
MVLLVRWKVTNSFWLTSFNKGSIMAVYFNKEGRVIMDIRKIVSAVAVVAVVGCASGPQTQQEKIVHETISNLPNWYTELPAHDSSKELYVAGTGASTNLSLAKDKAILDVEKQLANKISAQVSSRFKQYIREVGADTPLTIEDNEIVVKKLVTEAEVAGYEQMDSVVVREGKMFRIYVLANYPIEENVLRAIRQQEKAMRKFSGDRDKAFKELDAEINANRIDNNETPVIEDTPLIKQEDNYDPLANSDVKVYPNGIQEKVIVDNPVDVQTFALDETI